MVNFTEIISRIKDLTGKKRDKELADLFNLSPADFLNRRKRGTLLPLIVEWGLHESVNLDWLLTGEGPMRRDVEHETQAAAAAEKHPEVFQAVREILESGDDMVIKALKDRLADYRLTVAANRERRSIQQRLARIEEILESNRESKGGGSPGEFPGGAGTDASTAPEAMEGDADTGKKAM